MIPANTPLTLRFIDGKRYDIILEKESDTVTFKGVELKFVDSVKDKVWICEEYLRVVLTLRHDVAMRHRVQTPAYNSHIGDILSRRFESIGIKPIPGCPCKDLQNRLNSMTPEQVLSDLAGLTVKLRNSTKRWKELKGGVWNFVPSPPLWLCKRVLEDAVNEARGIIAAHELTDITIPG